MAGKRDLVVNDLDRYTKSSQRLVLEEYSSCEVPAGCGGGILRWIDPLEALPLHLRLWTTGNLELFFDGTPTRSSRIDARAGAHVLAMRVTPKGGAPPQLALGLRYSDETDAKGGFEPNRSRSVGRRIEVLSGAGAVIVGTAKEPAGDAWKLPGFDDGGWTPLSRTKAVLDGDKDWHLRYVTEMGAHAVGKPFEQGPLWVRCSFEVTLAAPAGGAP